MGSGPASVAPGRCVSPTSATDCHHEHPVRSLGSRITALSSFRRRAQLPCRLPGRNLGRQHDRVEPRLTSRLKLQRGRVKVPSVSREALPCPVLRSSSRSSPSSAPSSAALSAGSEGRRPASDALSRAPPRRPLGFDAQRPADKSSEDRLRPPRRQARRSSPVQSAWIATLRSTSTAPDRLKPFLHRRYATSQWRCPPGLSPCRTIVECHPGGVELLAESRQSSFLGTGPDRLAPHRCRPSRRSTRDHARRALSRSAWLGHLLSRARGATGWRGRYLRALARRSRAHLRLRSLSQTCFREARGLSTCFRRPPGQRARFSRSPAKRIAIRGAQGVFHP